VGDLGGGFVEALTQFDLGAHLAGQLGRDVKGLGFAFDQEREQEFGVRI
jgi:hypothetical protein